MKTLRILLVSAVVMALAASCLEQNETYKAGFYFTKPSSASNAFFANNLGDTLSFMSFGNWSISRRATDDGSWFTINTTSGKGNTLYNFPLLFEPNTTGKGRGVQLIFSDTDHPGDAQASIIYWQYGMRGDGTLGSARDVKAITGSDGSRFEFTYDVLHRPLSMRVTKEESLLHSLLLTYDDVDSVVTVQDKTKTLTSSFSNDYQPKRLIGSGDTIGYSSQYYSNGMPVSLNYTFNLEHHHFNGQNNTYYAYLLGGQSLMPDSLHNADSLRIATVTSSGINIDKLKLGYSQYDNRCQSVDVNQLLFGAENCDPYQLLSLFRYTRNTSIVSRMESNGETIEVTVSLNADKSVAQMTVTRTRPVVEIGAQQDVFTVTYTFEY